jgi:hypothetical protein
LDCVLRRVVLDRVDFCFGVSALSQLTREIMPVYCRNCGAYSLPAQMNDGLCLPCFIHEHNGVFIDPLQYASKFVEMAVELAQLRERRKAAVRMCGEYREQVQHLKALLKDAIGGDACGLECRSEVDG